MDDYVVRLARPDLSDDRAPERADGTWTLRRRRRMRRRVMVIAVALALFVVREPIMRTVDGFVDDLVDDVTAVDEGIGGAANVLNRVYEERGTYRTTKAELETLGPKIDWDEAITYDVCIGGIAAVVVSHGDTAFSRLLVRGEEWGQVPGQRRCPNTLLNPHPWSAPERSP